MHNNGFSKPMGIYEVDMDNLDPPEALESAFHAGESLTEGVSGKRRIDTTYENTSQDIVESPRSGENAPVPADLGEYPHRRY